MPRLSVLKHPILYYQNKYYHHKLKHGKIREGYEIIDIGNVKFPCNLSLGKMTQSMYYGAYDFEIKKFIQKSLNQGDCFIDVGANVGYFSAVGLDKVGKTGQVHCFEPISWLYTNLEKFKSLNNEYNIKINNATIGDQNGEITIYESINTGGHTILKDYNEAGNIGKQQQVKLQRLDNYLEQNNIKKVKLIKIDTEGYEFPVLLGLTGFFEKCQGKLPILVIEISHRAFELTNHSIEEFEKFMKSFGYKAFEICGCHNADIYSQKDQNLVFISDR